MHDKNFNTQTYIHSFEKVDYFFIGLVVLLIVSVTYHPFYFGDELIPWFVTGKNYGFVQSLIEYSGYKPRLIFNSLWIAFSSMELPRSVPAVILGITQACNAILIYKLISRICNDRLISWLAVIAFLTNRFGIVIWYDYLSGIIESLSLCFFIAGLYLLHSDKLDKFKLTIALLLFVSCVLVHERYGVAIFSVVVLSALFVDSLRPHRLYLLVISVAPVVVFIFLNQLMGENSISMGTSGQGIETGSKVLFSFITYLGNVFFQINYGKTWFFGALNLESIAGLTVSVASAAALLAIYIYGMTSRTEQLDSKKAIIYFGAIIAFIAVASLPGVDRQEGRWLEPVVAMTVILYAYVFSKRALSNILFLLIGINSFYFFTGSLNDVANVGSSKIAHKIGVTLTSGAAVGNNGLIIGGGNDTAWAIGGGSALGHNTYSGDLFVKANAIDDLMVSIQPQNKKHIDNNFDFALIRAAKNTHHLFVFKQYPMNVARSIFFPESLTDMKRLVLGQSGSWHEWVFPKTFDRSSELLLTKGFDGFYEADASKFHKGLLIYKAKKIDDNRTTMRIQVNWVNDKNEFMRAFIKVVELQKEAREYTAFIEAPAGAEKGLIYATLHDDSEGSAILESVSLGFLENN